MPILYDQPEKLYEGSMKPCMEKEINCNGKTFKNFDKQSL